MMLAGLLIDDALVLGTSAGLFAGKVDECAGGGDNGTLVANSIFVKLGDRSVAFDLDPVHVKSSMGEVLEITADHCGELRHDKERGAE